MTATNKSQHPRPFADTPRGRIRRDIRRAAIAAKRAWLEIN